jgi:tryptophan-rich sensory protein
MFEFIATYYSYIFKTIIALLVFRSGLILLRALVCQRRNSTNKELEIGLFILNVLATIIFYGLIYGMQNMDDPPVIVATLPTLSVLLLVIVVINLLL